MQRSLLLIVAFTTYSWGQGVSGMAMGILEQAGAAQKSVSEENSAAAADHIRQAKALASQILQTRVSESGPVLIEIKRQVETTTTYADVKKSKNGEMSADRMKPNTNVAEVDQEVTASLLDVTAASQKLDAAQSALERGDWQGAEAALRGVSGSVLETTVSGNQPLLRAQLNLELARARVLNGQPKDARLPLRTAAAALANYERMFPGPHAEAAEQMRQDMLAYADKISQDSSDAVDRINLMWLNPVEKWQREGGAKHVVDGVGKF